MGRGGQIQQLLSDLPVDEKWVLIGLGVLVLAAISHLYGMWREARRGIGDAGGGRRSHPAERYFEAWEAAGEEAGLRAVATENPLDGPRLVGRLRGLETSLEIQLQRSGRRNPDPEAINFATARCRVTGRLRLPSVWQDATVRRFIRPETVSASSVDDVTLGDVLPEKVSLTSTRLSQRSRRAIAELVDDFHTVTVVGGTLTVVDIVQPSRNTTQWKGMFGDSIDGLRRRARAFADGGLTIGVKSPRGGDGALEIRLDGGADKEEVAERLKEGLGQAGAEGVERSE